MESTINRVLQTWQSWDERLSEIEVAIGRGGQQARIIQQLKLEHFQRCRHFKAGAPRADEQAFLPLLDAAIRTLEKQVYPNILQRLFNRLKNVLRDRPAFINQWQQQRSDNLAQLKSELAQAGFSDFAANLEKQLTPEQSKQVISLSSQVEKGKQFNVSLHFEKDQQDLFRFTLIDATLKAADGKLAQKHQFKTEEWPGLKAIQIKNLLDGRAIKQKFTDITGSQRSHWLELPANGELKRFTQEYGYDLQTAIENLKADGLTPAGETVTLQKLELGQQVPAIWKHAGIPEMIYLQADPAHKRIRLADAANNTLLPEKLNQTLEKRLATKNAIVKQLSPARVIKTQAKNRRAQKVN
jgi:hypothetical protein